MIDEKNGIPFWYNKNVLKLTVVMAAQLFIHNKNHWYMLFKWIIVWHVNYISINFLHKDDWTERRNGKIPLSTDTQKINMGIDNWNSWTNWLDLIDIYKTPCPTTSEYIFFSSFHGTFIKMYHIKATKEKNSLFLKELKLTNNLLRL
jgi:hypothetical protein